MALAPANAAKDATTSMLKLGALSLSKAFWLQYISVILIILTCLIGSFCRANSNRLQADRVVVVSQPLNNFATYDLSTLFPAGGVALSGDVLQPFIAILLSHDLIAQIEVAYSGGEEQRSLALRRSTLIYQLILAAGVPPFAVETYVTLSPSSEMVSLALRNSEDLR